MHQGNTGLKKVDSTGDGRGKGEMRINYSDRDQRVGLAHDSAKHMLAHPGRKTSHLKDSLSNDPQRQPPAVYHRAIPPKLASASHSTSTTKPTASASSNPIPSQFCTVSANRLAGAALESLSEHENLELVVDGQHTGTSNTTENVGTGTLEERLDALLGDDLAEGIEGAGVLDGLT
jgi:hypothetical protein